MTLRIEWEEELNELTKNDYERVLPLLDMLEDEEQAIDNLRSIEREFEALQHEWRKKIETEDILNRIWRRLEHIQTLHNAKNGYKKTRWEMFDELVHEKDWKPVISIVEQMKAIDSDKNRDLNEETFNKIEKEYKSILPYITTEIGMGYRKMIMNEIEKRLRFYTKRLERQVKGDFGTWLKSARKEKGYSLKELEKRSGVTASYIHRIEKGSRNTPSIPIAEKLAVALGVPPRELLSALGNEVSPDATNEVPGLTELLTLNTFSVNGKPVDQSEKDQIVSLMNMMFNEEWDEDDIWSKGSDLLKSLARLKRQMNESN